MDEDFIPAVATVGKDQDNEAIGAKEALFIEAVRRAKLWNQRARGGSDTRERCKSRKERLEDRHCRQVQKEETL